MSEKIKLISLGCEKNLVDSEIMLGHLYEKGYEIIDEVKDADIIIVNTCGFIKNSKEESINTILNMADYKIKGKLKSLVVAGCLVQRYKEEIIKEIPEIDGIVGTNDFDRIVELIENSLNGKRPVYVGNPLYSYENIYSRKLTTPFYSAFLKIAEGCDNFCTFCVIPQIRGKFRSRTIESIVNEAEYLALKGVKELNIIAQDTTYYGMDIYGKAMLPILLEKLSLIEGIKWLRLHYLYPGYFSDELLSVMKNNKKVLKYIDLPLQHSVDHILKKMRRPGREKDIRSLINKIRTEIPDVTLRTSIIVGFPNETEEDFQELLKFIEEIKFDHLGVFTYSKEEGSAAARLRNQVKETIKERRAAQLMELQRKISLERNTRFIGRILNVLIEKYDQNNEVYVGRTEYDASEIDGEVFVSKIKANIGDILPVKITHAMEYDLVGEGI